MIEVARSIFFMEFNYILKANLHKIFNYLQVSVKELQLSSNDNPYIVVIGSRII